MADSVCDSECAVVTPCHCSTNNLECSGGPDNGFLVQVRAQVMTRDDSSGGWLPTHGGGMSVVGLRAIPPEGNAHYMIHGRRVCDQAVVLDCTVTDDLLYVKATPTFHHWRTSGKRFGLTFHSSADAQVFETCIQHAAHQLQERPLGCKEDNICEPDDEVLKLQPPFDAKEVSSLPASRTRTPSPTATMRVTGCGVAPRTARSFASSSTYHPFSCPHLDFAVERSFYRRCAAGHDKSDRCGAGGRKDSCVPEDELNSQGLERSPSSSDDILDDGPSSQTGRTDGYVRFSRTDISAASSTSGHLTSRTCVDPSRKLSSPIVDSLSTQHEYEYPALAATSTRESSLPPTIQQVSLPRRKQQKKTAPRRTKKVPVSTVRARCIYCQELFFVTENHCGVCPDAPDDCAACIERTTCLCAARALLYHCATDEDGDYGPVCGVNEDPTSSPGSGSSSERRRRRKWILLALLSIVLPCLWCYPALAACHRCNVRRGRCGARHRAA